MLEEAAEGAGGFSTLETLSSGCMFIGVSITQTEIYSGKLECSVLGWKSQWSLLTSKSMGAHHLNESVQMFADPLHPR